jgi:hypothetical protein
MFAYEFVRVKAPVLGVKADGLAGYQSVIHEQAQAGWRFVQLVIEQPAIIADHYMLIFERPVDTSISSATHGAALNA